jgi:hypothetical protein
MEIANKTYTRYENEHNGITVIGSVGDDKDRFLICRNKSNADIATMYLELADLKTLARLINEIVAEIEKTEE